MAFCTKCGVSIPDSASLCPMCAAVTTGQPPPPAAYTPPTATYTPQAATYTPPNPYPAAPAPAHAYYYVSSSATGQVTGPFSDEVINSLILQQRITASDSVAPQGSQVWVPVLQSRFAPLVAQQANLSRLPVTLCPRCSAGMAVIMKRSSLGLGLFIAGLVLIPAFGIGVPLIIVGAILRWGNEGTPAYYCPRCNYPI